MAVYYVLEPLECATDDGGTEPNYARSLLKRIDALQAEGEKNPIVKVISPEQFDNLALLNDTSNDFLHSLVAADSNFVDTYADHIIGSFSVPDKNDLLGDVNSFAFYANHHYLIFADDTDTAEDILETIATMGVVGADTIGHVLYVFMKQLLVDEVEYMAEIQTSMEDLEEAMLEKQKDVDTITIMHYRRQSMKLASYYEQISTMADVLSDNESKLMTTKDSQSFDHIASYADRLVSRGEALENYSLQLHELHQTRIDLKQNAIMQTLTVVTVVLAPLTLVTSWFGMNIAMPGLDFSFTWVILVVLFAIIIVALLLYFCRKKWL